MTAIVICLLAIAHAAPARATIRYDISLARPAEHQFHVTMTIPAAPGGVTVQMPAWNALYQIRDFAYRISDFHAIDATGNALAGASRWINRPGASKLTCRAVAAKLASSTRSSGTIPAPSIRNSTTSTPS